MSDDETPTPEGALTRLKDISQMTDDEIEVYASELRSQIMQALKEPGDSPLMPGLPRYTEFKKRMYAEQERVKESRPQD